MPMKDIRSLLQKRAEQTLTGTFYERRPETPTDGGAPFQYEYVNPSSWTFRRLFGNVVGNQFSVTAVKTVSPLYWRVSSFIVTQDGRLYTILQVERDLAGAGKQAQRLFCDPAGVSYVLRLAEVENPWGIN